jgi:hypothetical protein
MKWNEAAICKKKMTTAQARKPRLSKGELEQTWPKKKYKQKTQ